MILREEDAALFYRAWGALLTWVNDQRHIVPQFPRPTPDRPIDPSFANQIRKVVWAEDALRDRFLIEGAADLAGVERDLIASWQHRVAGSFVVLKHLQKHSIFMSKDVYAVLGIYTPLAAMIPRLPMFVEGVLLPFRDVIITDGLLQSHPMQISFGAGARRAFANQYSEARATAQVRTELPARAELAAAPPAVPARRPARGTRRAPSGAFRSPQQHLHGEWRITATELWDREALDTVRPAFIRFDADRLGGFGMIVIQADLDCRYAERDGKPLVEFTFEGDDDGHPCLGRGWATLDADGRLRGRFYIHRGDDSDFEAVRATSPTPAPRRRPTRPTRTRR